MLAVDRARSVDGKGSRVGRGAEGGEGGRRERSGGDAEGCGAGRGKGRRRGSREGVEGDRVRSERGRRTENEEEASRCQGAREWVRAGQVGCWVQVGPLPPHPPLLRPAPPPYAKNKVQIKIWWLIELTREEEVDSQSLYGSPIGLDQIICTQVHRWNDKNRAQHFTSITTLYRVTLPIRVFPSRRTKKP